ncbi:MAG TPA: 16S rRNA (cytosine(1402)-N(4))-methyltransferase RsmH [Acidimicrobiales bacterium]|nr:16S rRNA (cytosine(1402)-N(4))-methyltransferase RsmH [Acidimicrobiales bacterium]
MSGATSSARSLAGTIERLQMAQDSYHVPVLASEIVELFTSLPAGVVVDATLGGGGHADAILRAAPQIRLLGIDRDPEARQAAQERLGEFGDRVRIVDATFGELSDVMVLHQDFLHSEPVVGVLMDLGVSSHQLDESSRGFSFRVDAPLDMRMDPTKGETAAQLLSHIDRHDLARLLRDNGENRFAGSIAKIIIERQPQTTHELTEAVERAVPMAARRRGHVATRVFQALRIAVNAEEEQLERGLDAALDVLSPGGVLAVISYHSGEDRVVKSVLHEAATGGCHCPVELGCVCGAVPTVTVFKASAQLASASEIESNPRARSARLRIARKLPS